MVEQASGDSYGPCSSLTLPAEIKGSSSSFIHMKRGTLSGAGTSSASFLSSMASTMRFQSNGEDEEDEEEDADFIPLSTWTKGRKSQYNRSRRGSGVTGPQSEGSEPGFTPKAGPSITKNLAWADLDDLFDSNLVTPIDRMFHRFIMQPYTPKRLAWDLCGFVFVCLDIVFIPLSVFEPARTGFDDTLEWLGRFFWSFDIAAQFLTGVLSNEGQVEMNVEAIARVYLRTWFALDTTLVLMDWADFAITSAFEHLGGGIEWARALQIMRVLRVFRLARLFRLTKNAPSVSRSIFFKVHSEVLTIILSILRIMVIVVVITHILACVWYGAAVNSEADVTWLMEEGLDQESIGYRYTASFHWALTQFIGSSDIVPHSHLERTIAVVVLLMGFVITSSAVGSITTAMTRLQFIAAHSMEQMTLMNRYLAEHGISSRLAARVHRSVLYALSEQKRNTPESQVELMSLLSEPLRIELHYEINGPVLQYHPFFRCYNKTNPAAVRQVCHQAMNFLTLARSDTVFSEGEVPSCPKMFFVLSGRLLYMREGADAASLSQGQWAAEPVLWTPWVHQGVLKAVTDCSLLCLDREQFCQIALTFRTQDFYPAEYASEYVDCLNTLDKGSLMDIHDRSVDIDDILRKVFGEEVIIQERRASGIVTKLMRSRRSRKSQAGRESCRESQASLVSADVQDERGFQIGATDSTASSGMAAGPSLSARLRSKLGGGRPQTRDSMHSVLKVLRRSGTQRH